MNIGQAYVSSRQRDLKQIRHRFNLVDIEIKMIRKRAILGVISVNPGLTAANLSGLLEMRQMALIRALYRLRKVGYVINHRRTWKITEKGEAFLNYPKDS